MSAITYDRIQIEDGFGIHDLRKFTVSITPNQHARAYLKGVVKKGESLENWSSPLDDHVVKIYLLNEDGSRPAQPFFSGYIEDVTFISESGYHLMELKLYSGTIALDRGKKSASYQDVSKSYADILRLAIKNTEKAAAICTVGKDEKPVMPIIQYRETNWEFALRLASHLNSVIYPEVKEPRPWFWFGKPNQSGNVKLTASSYSCGISKRYYELGGSEAGLNKKDFVYYVIDSKENYELEMGITYQNQSFMIYEKHARLDGDVLIFTYHLGHAPIVSLKKQYNPLFAGMAILGKVMETGGETVKIHLDIDEKQDVSTVYPYEWTPDTGSVMYCMPKKGTTVSLYFSSDDEMSGHAVNCIRENGATCKAMSDPSKRALTTEHGKQMFLNPDAMGFSTGESEHVIALNDENGIAMGSKQKIRIWASGKLTLKGKKVLIKTPKSLRVARK